jgi:hypothetical protein
VEVNPHIAELLTGRYHGFTGRVFSDPRVELVVAEGRHFLSTTSERFDAIQLSGVDTFAALSSGAYALAEAYLYTVEAVGDFLDHLAPGGLLSYSRYEFEPPRETIRNVSNMIEALRRRGVPDPAGRLMVVAGKEWANCMVKPDGFTAEEKEAVRRSTAALGFRVSYDPDRPGHDAYDRLVRAGPEERAAFLRDYAYDVSPVLDDRPFFFQYFKPRTLLRPPPGVDLRRDWPVVVPTGLLTLAVTLVLLTLLSALLILAPLRGRVGAGAGARRGAVFGYFAALGLGFLFVEITLMQAFTVFLGNPTYALSVVLFTLLSSSAVGSALTQGRDARLTLLALPPVLVAAAFGLRAALPALLGLPLAGRIACTMALLAPLGLLLGTAFPQGIRRLAGAAPALVPWAFAVNACFTVLGSASAVLLALLAGFRVPMIAAALLYALAAALLPRLATGRPID